MREPSHICDLHHSSQQLGILNPMSEASNWTCVLMDTSQICFHWATAGTPFFLVFFVVVVFLGPHPRHMEVPRLGVETELQLLAYTTATVTWDPSCTYTIAHSNTGFLTHWVRPGIKPASRVCYHWATTEAPKTASLSLFFFFGHACSMWKFPGQGSKWEPKLQPAPQT